MSSQRSRLFVDPPFQGRLLLRLVMYWFVYHVALWHLTFLLSLIGHYLNADPSAPPKTMWALYTDFTAEHISLIVCFLVLLPILGRDLLKFSHRIAGPLVRFRNTMQTMADGKPAAQITLRPRDLLTEFLGVFNNMVKAWNARLQPAPPARPEDEALELVESR